MPARTSAPIHGVCRICRRNGLVVSKTIRDEIAVLEDFTIDKSRLASLASIFTPPRRTQKSFFFSAGPAEPASFSRRPHSPIPGTTKVLKRSFGGSMRQRRNEGSAHSELVRTLSELEKPVTYPTSPSTSNDHFDRRTRLGAHPPGEHRTGALPGFSGGSTSRGPFICSGTASISHWRRGREEGMTRALGEGNVFDNSQDKGIHYIDKRRAA